jgi:hypothetical protein
MHITRHITAVSEFKELFIEQLVNESFNKQTKSLDYKDLPNLVQENDKYEFLKDILPFKMKAKDALKLINSK